MSRFRIAVLGAGAVGGYFAAVLTRAGHEVAIIARGAHVDAIRHSGLHVRSAVDEFSVRPAVVTREPEQVGHVDAVIVAVKAWQVREAAGSMNPLLGKSSRILPLQNGIEAAGQLREVLGEPRVLDGTCRVICMLDAPARIRQLSLRPVVMLGEAGNAPLSETSRSLASALSDCGTVVETPLDMQVTLWEKLLFLAPLSMACAVARSTIGEIRACGPTRALLESLMAEVASVARGAGVRLTADAVSRAVALVDAMPPEGTVSMQRDVTGGKPSELEAIVGVIVRRGRESGVPTPLVSSMYGALLPQEKRARSVGARADGE